MKQIKNKIKEKKLTQILQELHWINGYSRRYIWAVCWYVLLGIITTALGLIATIISKDIIDIVTGFQTGFLVWAAIAYISMQVAKIMLSAITGRISAKVQLRVSQDLRADIFEKIINAKWEPLSQYHSGDLIARSSRDADTVASSIMSWMPTLIINSLQFVGTFLILAYYDLTLALLALGCTPLMLILSGVLTKRIRQHSEQMRTIGSEMTSFHAEIFQNIQFLKSLNALDIASQRFSNLQQKQKNATLEFNRFSILISSVLSFMGMIIGGLSFFWSIYRLWTNHITFGEMTLFLQFSGSLAAAFSALVSLIPSAITTATAAGRIMEITELPKEEITDQDDLHHILNTANNGVKLQANNIDFSYNSGKVVFENADFSANPGEIVALIGPSGGGKTTLLRLLLGILTVKNGVIKLQGGNPEITLSASASTRKLFAYVPQGNTLLSGTIAENLRMTNPKASDSDIEEALNDACALEFVKKLPESIYSKIGERGRGLSEGQLQRLSIARALLSDAPILLLDEATSALDIQTERQLLCNITQNRKNRTCIVTTHKKSVLEICDRFYLIENQTVTQVENI